ncbi:hypothetical protein [Membranihabitans maritimus]|uniref:hypothetical protein n=1 Tax=Membranihabitans maritimus TaxID=2904244 RepID=UPI001F29E15E|nr:hypothetical protein [Membranihabitans maritimus]
MKTFLKILFGIGAVLLLINIAGLFKTMRNPELYEENRTGRLNDITIEYPEINEMLLKKPDESNREFAIRLNKIVSKGMIHYWRDPAIDKYHLRVPIWENYMLFAASYIKPDRYLKYEFTNYRKNLERGLGVCSTHSTVVKGVLNEHGIEAELWDIAGHVVVTAQVSENESIILDPDYGIFVPYDIEAIESDPEITRASYASMHELYKPEYDDPYTTDIVVDLYGKEGNHTYVIDHWFEHFSYVAIWVLPFLFMLPGIFLFNKK